jgi:energy-coupling factor transport system permease protein
MRVALAYAPRPGPLGTARPAVAALYLGPLAAIAFAFSSPLVLAGAGLAALLAAAASGALRAALVPLRFGLFLAVTIIVVNGLVTRRGDTVLLRGGEMPLLGPLDVTAEALAEGCMLALRILVALAVFAVWSACVDPDRILRALRPWAARSALAASLVSRLVPLAAADAARLGEAARLRGPAAAPVGRAALARRLIAGSLDRSVDVAATLELRGYGLGGRFRAERRPRRPGEAALAAAGVALALAALLAAASGAGGFEAYPTIVLGLDPATVAFALALPLLAALPFAAAYRRRRRRHSAGATRAEAADA